MNQSWTNINQVEWNLLLEILVRQDPDNIEKCGSTGCSIRIMLIVFGLLSLFMLQRNHIAFI